jgi:NADH dehydrogenase
VAAPPLVSERYITARRRAECAISDLDVEVVVPRFGPVYGPGQPHFPEAVNLLFGALGRFEPLARRLGTSRPFAVEQAAAETLGELS